MIEKIKEFFYRYAKCEHEANVASFERELGYEGYEKFEKSLKKFSGANMVGPVYSKKRFERYNDEKLELFCSRYFPRMLFQIKHYQNPKLGKELEEKFPDVKDVYVCYVSNNKKTAFPVKMFSDKFSIVDTKDGLKFINREIYMPKREIWVDFGDWKPSKILKYGKLIATYKIQAPEHPPSLEEYEKG